MNVLSILGAHSMRELSRLVPKHTKKPRGGDLCNIQL